MKKIILTIIQSVFLIGLIFVSITLISSRFSILGFHSYNVVTGSMEPKVHVGSVVFTMPAKTYNVGDIITFNRGKISITHRIVDIKNKQYQTKGDANNVVDQQLVDKANIIGKDFIIIPYLGKFTEFLRSVPGFLIFILIPIMIYVVLESLTIKKEWEKSVKKKLIAEMQRLEQAI